MSSKKKPAKPSKKPVKKAAPKRPPAKAKPATKPAIKATKKQEPVAKKKEAPPKKEAATKTPVPKPPKSASKAARKKPAPALKAMPVSQEAKPGLGFKWACFQCNAKFYDMGKPDPVCPRCGADQRTRPAIDAPPPPPAPRRPPPPPMARYLEDEEAPADEAFVDEGEEEAAEIDIEAIEESGTFVEPDYEDE
jgi:hypothetical protein